MRKGWIGVAVMAAFSVKFIPPALAASTSGAPSSGDFETKHWLSPEAKRTIRKSPGLQAAWKLNPDLVVEVADQLNEEDVVEVDKPGLGGVWWLTETNQPARFSVAERFGVKVVRRYLGGGTYIGEIKTHFKMVSERLSSSCSRTR